jgi:hypothetical protein
MALADQSVTINAVAIPLPRIGSGLTSGIFQSSDGLVKETFSHTFSGKRNRRLARIDHRKVAADPFVTTANAEYKMAAYLVVDVPTIGYTVVEQKQVIDGFITQLNASSGALITKLLGSES